jgi:hypothetical protein
MLYIQQARANGRAARTPVQPYKPPIGRGPKIFRKYASGVPLSLCQC